MNEQNQRAQRLKSAYEYYTRKAKEASTDKCKYDFQRTAQQFLEMYREIIEK